MHGERQHLTVEEPAIGASMVTGVHAQVTVYVKESRAADHSQSMVNCCLWLSFTAGATSASRVHVGLVQCSKNFGKLLYGC
jgi:head-tail adaptor